MYRKSVSNFKRIGAVDFELESSPSLKKLSARKNALKSSLRRRGGDLQLHISVSFTPIDFKFSHNNLNIFYINPIRLSWVVSDPRHF